MLGKKLHINHVYVENKTAMKRVFMRRNVLEPLLEQKLISYSGKTSKKHLEMFADRWRRLKLGPIIKVVKEDFPEDCPKEKLQQFSLGSLEEPVVEEIEKILKMDHLFSSLETSKKQGRVPTGQF